LIPKFTELKSKKNNDKRKQLSPQTPWDAEDFRR
jgi:hypothetical protein